VNNALTAINKWEAAWDGAKLPAVRKPVPDIQKLLETYLPHDGDDSLIEIGCAPGGWMAYFSRQFGYRVAGIEYAEEAANTTKKNMEILKIDADVVTGDFFSYDCTENQFDIVFSAGFIEHFRDIFVVMQRLCALSKKYIVTIVPNLFGVNGFISKTIRPAVYAEHNPMDLATLDLLHTHCGLQTLFCNYVGGIQFIMPGAHNAFFKRHPWCAKAVNAPVRAVNSVSSYAQRITGCSPRTRLCSDSLLYIGVKNAED